MTDPDAVRAHVDKILASPGFLHADRLRRFLHFTVQAHLNGEAGQIKEYVLGREVFDRDEGYDPRLDPIVRVEARRLRQRLQEYYDGPGRQESLRIEFPKGSYVPSITEANRQRPARSFVRPLVAAVGLLSAGLGAYFLLRPAAPRQMLAVVPARWTFGDSSGLDRADERLAEAITARVANRGRVPVIGWPSIVPYRQHPATSADLANRTGATMVMAVSIRAAAAQSRVSVFLIEPFTGRKRWAEDFYSQNVQSPDTIRELAETIAQDLEVTLGVSDAGN